MNTQHCHDQTEHEPHAWDLYDRDPWPEDPEAVMFCDGDDTERRHGDTGPLP